MSSKSGKRPVPTTPAASSHHIPTLSKESSSRPVPTDAKFPKEWGFSFSYWKQIDYFGLGEKQPHWFLSLLERLQEISRCTLKQLKTDSSFKDTTRIHPIKWTQKNIPLQRRDLTWLPLDILNNDVEFPIMQFSISTALGRVAGFWDTNVFYIVLLDPHHNLQPTKDTGFKVTETTERANEVETILSNLSYIANSPHSCNATECASKAQIRLIKQQFHPAEIVYLKKEYHDVLSAMVDGNEITTIDAALELLLLRQAGV